MACTLRPDACLRVASAMEPPVLYDCHGQQFAPVEHGATMADGFVPLFLAQLFGVEVSQWPATLAGARRALATRTPDERAAWLKAHEPCRSARAAAEMALLAYPSAERFVERRRDAWAPFRLRDAFLYQPNVPLTRIEVAGPRGRHRHAFEDAASWHDVLATAAAGTLEDGDDRPAARMLRDAGMLCEADPAPRPPPPGLVATGHSSFLVRGRRTGLLVDPVPLAPLAARPGSLSVQRLRASADAVALTHGHFDHYHVPSLLAAGDGSVIVPPVPRATIVCEDLEARLRGLGLPDVRAPQWGETVERGDIRLHVLPFRGEQFLTSEEWPDARNWGHCYVAEVEGVRVLLAVDAGFERDRSVFDVVDEWVQRHGPVDVVAAQSIALQTSFGQGDPDLQITALTCAHRATEALALQAPDRRVTLAVDDLLPLCRIAGARWFVPYGQFRFDAGAPAVDPGLTARIRAQLEPDVRVVDLAVGEGLAFDPLGGRIDWTGGATG